MATRKQTGAPKRNIKRAVVAAKKRKTVSRRATATRKPMAKQAAKAPKAKRARAKSR